VSKDAEDFCLYSTVGNGDNRIFPIMPFQTVRHVAAETFDSISDQMVVLQAEVLEFRLADGLDVGALVACNR